MAASVGPSEDDFPETQRSYADLLLITVSACFVLSMISLSMLAMFSLR
jgi:hypothetical protein